MIHHHQILIFLLNRPYLLQQKKEHQVNKFNRNAYGVASDSLIFHFFIEFLQGGVCSLKKSITLLPYGRFDLIFLFHSF